MELQGHFDVYKVCPSKQQLTKEYYRIARLCLPQVPLRCVAHGLYCYETHTSEALLYYQVIWDCTQSKWVAVVSQHFLAAFTYLSGRRVRGLYFCARS